MAVGSIQRLPRFAADGKTVVPASIINLSLGADHRQADRNECVRVSAASAVPDRAVPSTRFGVASSLQLVAG